MLAKCQHKHTRQNLGILLSKCVNLYNEIYLSSDFYCNQTFSKVKFPFLLQSSDWLINSPMFENRLVLITSIYGGVLVSVLASCAVDLRGFDQRSDLI